MVRAFANSVATDEQRLRMSYEEFLERFDDSTHGEWIDGEVTIFMPPGDRHQDIVGFLLTVLRLFLRTAKLGVARTSPFAMRLQSGRSYREPDLLVVLNEHLDRIGEMRLEGPADVIVEVVSPESVRRDREDKYKEYEAAGVTEYWIVESDAQHPAIEGYLLDANGHYHPIPAESDGKLRSVVLTGFWFDPAWLGETPLPDERQLADEMESYSSAK